MKPVKLIIEGINSFIERQELDFTAVGRSNLFCICGKTGAGKTTIFDSLLLALYGKSGKGNLADTVNLSLMSAFVSLEFVEGDDLYRVDRTIKCRKEKTADGAPTDRRVASSECMLYKNGEPFAKGSDEANQRISDIIGLDVAEFKNVYLLEQGEYAEFLKKQPAKQSEAVGKIFSLMRFGDVFKLAGEKQKEEQAAVDAVDGRIADLGEDSPDALRSVKTLLSTLRAKNTALGKELEAMRGEITKQESTRLEYASFMEKQRSVKANAQRLDAEKAKIEAAKAELDAFVAQNSDDDRQKLEALRKEINVLTELNALDKQLSAARTELNAKREAEKRKAAALGEITENGAAITQKVDTEFGLFREAANGFIRAADGCAEKSDALDRAVKTLSSSDRAVVNSLQDIVYSLRDDKRRYEELSAKLDEANKDLAVVTGKQTELIKKVELYGEELERAKSASETLKSERDRTAAEYKAALTQTHAEAVRAELNVGDVCPVCGGIYGGFECAGNTDAAQKKRAADEAAAAFDAAVAKIADTERHTEKAKDELFRIGTEKEKAEARVGEIRQSLIDTRVDAEVYEKLAIALKAARIHADAYSASAMQKTEYEPKLSAANAEYAAAVNAREEAERTEKALSERLCDNCGKTEAALVSAKKEAEALEKAIAERDGRRAELVSAYEAAKAAAQAIEKMLEEARASCPVDIPEFDEEKYSESRARLDEMIKTYTERERDIAVKAAEADSLAEKCEKLKALHAERTQRRKSADNYAKIAELTKGRAMLNYVAIEYIEQFTAAASDILGELSDGKYALDYNSVDGFTVSDFLNGGKSRKTDTLSGGELFLASLSVAIAIARSVGHGNNAFFFLDEGFGTLDDELIDTVYGALESLSKDCLVGVISHASALIERMPSCVEIVEATDTSGSRIRY